MVNKFHLVRTYRFEILNLYIRTYIYTCYLDAWKASTSNTYG